MDYLDLCRMRELGYTSTKLHFSNSWVHKPLKFTPLSVYVRDAFRISTWSLSRWLCFHGRNSRHSLFFCWWLSNSVALLRRPLLDWGWTACIRCKASCTEPRCPYSDGTNTCTVPPLIYIYKYIKYTHRGYIHVQYILHILYIYSWNI